MMKEFKFLKYLFVNGLKNLKILKKKIRKEKKEEEKKLKRERLINKVNDSVDVFLKKTVKK